jgi:hypothetical protein
VRLVREPVMSAALDLHSSGSMRPHSSFVAHPATMAAGEDELGVDIGGEAGAQGGSGSASASPRAFPARAQRQLRRRRSPHASPVVVDT